MGLDTTHDCWHSSYGAFAEFRTELADAAMLPYPLTAMQGFGGHVQWKDIPYDPIHILLNHSDCDGAIAAKDCLPLAERLEELAQKLPGTGYISMRERALQFAKGLRAAAAKKQKVIFH